MEAPYPIASIPNPIDGVNGRVHTGPVYGVRDSKKRKRHEVVIGVDGEGVNIYNIQAQIPVTSYALPPQSYLCCPPASVCLRGIGKSSPQRITYCVVKDAPKDPRRRLVRFAENLRRGADDAVAPQRREFELSDREIAGLDIIPLSTDDHLAVAVTYNTGATLVLEGDLSKGTDLGRLSGKDSDEDRVLSTAVVNVQATRKGLLKNREDVCALLDQIGNSPMLQWRITQTANARRFELLALRLAMSDGAPSFKRGMTLLMSYDLPSKSKQNQSGTFYELHTPSGTLYELSDDKASIYDLSGAAPRFVTRIGSRSAPISSFVRLSASSILAVSRDVATIYETKYGSVQGSMSLATPARDIQSKKRKHDEMDGQTGLVHVIASFVELGLAVGAAGNELIALPLSDRATSQKRSKNRGIRLADVIGKGAPKDSQSLRNAEKKLKKWDEWVARVDEMVDASDIEGLEALVANDGKLGRQRKCDELSDLDRESGLVYNDSATYQDLWPLPEAFDPQSVNRNKVFYLLSKVFSYSPQDHSLEIAIGSTKLLEWLALTGSLSVTSIRNALRSMKIAAFPEDAQLKAGDLMTAIRKIDADFQLTHDLLHLPVHWDVEGVIEALRLILQSFGTDQTAEMLLALLAPPASNGDIDLVNGDANPELEAAEDELEYAESALTTGLEVRSDALRAIFSRLHALHHTDVTAAMRSIMSQDELFFLVHILRIEMADGGWTSRYVDVGESGDVEGAMVDALAGIEESGPSDESIKVIGYLLNCAIDAIGVGGWLVGLGGNLSAKDLVDSLRAEVSAGYEGCLEANTVQAFLAEIEKYSGNAESSTHRSEEHSAEDSDRFDAEMRILPVGGRAAPPVLRGRNGKGGEKSKIARAQEKSRSVGKYTFERIRI